MKKLFSLLFFVLLIGLFFYSCKEELNSVEPESSNSQTLYKGTETLGPPEIAIAEGSGFIVAGTGLVTQPGTIDLSEIPSGATVKQVLLYWTGGFDNNLNDYGDNTIIVNSVEFTGESIGGPIYFYQSASGQAVTFESFRYDITDEYINDWGMPSSAEVSGMNNGMLYGPQEYNENDGAGILVIYDDGTSSEIQLLDGQDLAFDGFSGDLKVTVPQTFNFTPSNVDRPASLGFFAGSVAENRPNVIRVNINGVDEFTNDLFGSNDGADWDSPILPVVIPAGVGSITVELISDGSRANPASLTWITAALSIDNPPSEDCGECDGKITKLTLQNNGPGAVIKVVQKKPEVAIFNSFVGAGATFTFEGVDDKGTMSTEISVYVDDILNVKIHTSCSQDIFIGSVFGLFTVIDGYSRNGGKLCPDGGNGGGPCEISSQKVKIDKKKLEWEIKNEGTETATISSIYILWPESNGALKKIEFDKKIYDQETSWNAAGVTFTQFIGDLKDRQIKKGDKEKLKFEFKNNAAAGPYSIVVVFEEGCEIALDIPGNVNGGGDACTSKIAATSLKYTGDPLTNVTVKFVGKSKQSNASSEYNLATLNTGDILDDGSGWTVSGLPGDLGSKMSIFINGELHEVHHTSCSVEYVKGLPAPLDNPKGNPSPNWEVVDFIEKN